MARRLCQSGTSEQEATLLPKIARRSRSVAGATTHTSREASLDASMLQPQLQLDAPPQQSASNRGYAQTFLHAHPTPDHQVRRVYRQGLGYILLIGTKEEHRNETSLISLYPRVVRE
jgi:hypothetical protein